MIFPEKLSRATKVAVSNSVALRTTLESAPNHKQAVINDVQVHNDFDKSYSVYQRRALQVFEKMQFLPFA